MNSIINALSMFFTGKGSTLRLAIVGSLAAATVYEFIDNQYSFKTVGKDGVSVVLKPETQVGQNAEKNTQPDSRESGLDS